jgi:hypothetical protein
MKWSRKSSLDAPTVSKPSFYGGHQESDFARPLGHGERPAAVCQQAVRSLIQGLLASCGPSTVLRRVRAVVVDAVEAMSIRRTYAHVREELFECVPSAVDRDTSASVVVKGGAPLIAASVQHLRPGVVLDRFITAVCHRRRSHAATTGLRSSTTQGRPIDRFFGAAVASTRPFGVLAATAASDDNELSETLSSDVDRGARHIDHFLMRFA